MSDTVKLINLSGRARAIVLDHPAFREKRWGFRRSSIQVVDQSRTGQRAERTVRVSLLGSLTLPAGGEVAGLHPAIEHVPQVASLIRRGLARVEADPSAPSSPPARQEPAGADPPQPGGDRAMLGSTRRARRVPAEAGE